MAAKLTALIGSPLTAADLAIVFTVANAVGPITMISGGFVNDRLGPRAVLLTGSGQFGPGRRRPVFGKIFKRIIK